MPGSGRWPPGAGGSTSPVVSSGSEDGPLPSTPPEPLSDAGAGDGMVAAIASRLTAGDDPVSACALVAVAAAAMLTPSTEPFHPEVARALLPEVKSEFQAHA
ncbi:PfkB family carbohydrate kinase [Streptomyces sp. NPDC004050]